MSIKIFSTIPY